jgi:predicted NBD/HSP70 family sugar kinase
MKVLVVDIGGSHIKFAVPGKKLEKREFSSGKEMTPAKMLKKILSMTPDWKYEAVSIGFPGKVLHGRIAKNPGNLGKGWVNFNFEKHFKKPVKVMNDAAMQALGSYQGGRMLFLGLGTGLGSTLILDGVVVPLELGELKYSKEKSFGEILGKPASKEDRRKWEAAVHEAVGEVARAFSADYVVIGGGNARRLKHLPACARRGSNKNAFKGGVRLWTDAVHKKHTLVIR